MDEQTKHRVTIARLRLKDFGAALNASEDEVEALLRVHALLIARALQTLRPANGREAPWAKAIEAVGFTSEQAQMWIRLLEEVDDHLVQVVQPLLTLASAKRDTVMQAVTTTLEQVALRDQTFSDFPAADLERVAPGQMALFGALVEHRVQAQLKANNVARVLVAARAGAWSPLLRLKKDREAFRKLPPAELAHAVNHRLRLWCFDLIVGQFPVDDKSFLLGRPTLPPLAKGHLEDLVEALIEDVDDPGLWHLGVSVLDPFSFHHLTTLQALENNRTVGLAPFGESEGEDRLASPVLLSPALVPG